MSANSPSVALMALAASEGKVAMDPIPKPASLPISVQQVGDQPLLCIKVGPLFTYANIDEAVALRAQLDAEIARLSERFL